MTSSQLIPQRDNTILITPGEGREAHVDLVRGCAQLLRIVAGAYVYRISPVAIWGAAARGVAHDDLLRRLNEAASQPLPAPMVRRIAEPFSRFGVMRIRDDDGTTVVVADDPTVLQHLPQEFAARANGGKIELKPAEVGRLRIAAAGAGWPVLDERIAHCDVQSPFELSANISLRPYQRSAVQALLRARDGVVLLPCGAGKTIVGIAVAAMHAAKTLILTPSRSVAVQWQAQFRDCTTVDPDAVGIIERGSSPQPITIATYHAATLGSVAGTLFDHPWGLVIYDEVQSLPADVFRLSAAYSAFRRVGLTATLIREDGLEREVVALIGPVVYDEPWTVLEREGWIAPALCAEVRIPSVETLDLVMRYKLAATERLLAQCAGEQTIVIGTDLALLRAAARKFDMALVTGATPNRQREETLDAFRTGSIRTVALSRIGSVGIDVPNASVLIQLSGTFGSRQEEAQRLGRILRPQAGKVARFFSLVIDDPREVRFAERRQRFLVDQGYRYSIIAAADLPRTRVAGQSHR